MSEKRVLTAEERESLQGLAPFSQSATSEYTPKPYVLVAESLRPVFTIRPLTKEKKKAAEKLLANVKDADGDAFTEMARWLVVGWRNLWDAGTGELVVHEGAEDGGTKKELFETLPSAVVSNVLVHAYKISGLLDAEKLGLSS